MRRRRVLVGLTLVVLTMGVGAPPAVANVLDELQLVTRSSPEQGSLELVVAVPERFTGATLPDGSFTALAGDQRLVVTTTPIPSTSLSVLVIVDTDSTVPAAAFDRQRAAVAELARALEPGTRLGLATTTSPFRLLDATDDRSALLTALGNLAAGGTASPVQALAAAASLAGPDPGTRIVLFADSPTSPTDELAPAAGGAPTDVVRSGRAGATTSDGVVRVHHVDSPLQFVDGLAAELTGQYRLEVTLPQPTPETVTVRLDAGGLALELPVTLSTAATDAEAAASTLSPTVAAVSQSRISPATGAPPTTLPPSAPSSVSATTAAEPTSAPTTQDRPASEGDETDTSLLFWVAVIATPAGLALMVSALFARRSASSPRRRRRSRRAARRVSQAKPPLLVPRPTSVDGRDEAAVAALDVGWPHEDDELVGDDPLVDDPLADESLAYAPLADEPSADGPLADEPPPDEEPVGGPFTDDDRPDDEWRDADDPPEVDESRAADEMSDDALTDEDDLAWADVSGGDDVAAGLDGPQGEDAPVGEHELVDDPATAEQEPQPSPLDDSPAAEHQPQALPHEDPQVPPDAAVTTSSVVVPVVPVEQANPGTSQAHRHARRSQRWPARRVASVTMMVASDIFLRRRHHRP